MADVVIKRRKSKQRGKPIVVEFVDPALEDRQLRERKKRKRKRKKDQEEEMYARRKETSESDDKKIWVSVKALGAVGLKGKEKWKYRSELIQSLGGKKPKNRKVPLNILLGMRKKEKKRQMWRDKQIRESGVVVARPNDLSTSSQNSNRKKRKKLHTDRQNFMRPSFGHFKSGTLFVGNRNKT